ncbi:hypothetical protein ACLKMH_13905 [Psychromonas sp. KJ10-10]|uniref:hypothetical protein n=1 Tax=Psychromonas sp. KJ10-10 TaxID=3391823 RepID=UPI0039B49886
MFPTVCAIAWMVESAQSVYSDYQYLGLTDYKLFKGIIFDGSEAQDYVIDLNLLPESETNIIDVEVKISSTNISSTNKAGKTIFHYSAILKLVKKGSHQSDISEYKGELPSLKTEQHTLYEDGTLFHGESLQGITAINHCDDDSLLLSCLIKSSAQEKQGSLILRSIMSLLMILFFKLCLCGLEKSSV